MAKKKWNELSSRTRRLIIAGGVFEGVLKVAALNDLARRHPSEVRGSKLRWALAVTLINSIGAGPSLTSSAVDKVTLRSHNRISNRANCVKIESRSLRR